MPASPELGAALADRYRIERELGQGGMATVYLAHDLKHDRDVALKVLRPELAAALGAERFLGEIRTTARLQHPHILPLYDSGEAGGLLFYVMPYVAGESLRDRLERERQLGLDEALGITRQLAGALAYAHRHGVIHRDIKPENILLSEGEAMLADFGIALAVREAAGPRLTETGLSLGTPQYMSPEQATGDRELDVRSDIYSLAAVLYEMLAGEPPVTGPTAQAVIAKLLTERPTRLRNVRETVPEGIDTAVVKALAKVPADRFASAADFAAALTLTAPSGAATSAGGATSTLAVGAPRRAHPVRVGALFGVAAAAVLAGAWLLMQGLGLPTWVFAATIGVLAAGFPLVVLTAVFERRRAAPTGDTGTAFPHSVERWLTWRRSLTAGGLALGGVAVATTVYMAMRLLGIGPLGTLVARGALKVREPILLVDFANRSPDTTLGPTLTEALRVDLSQSPVVKLLGPEEVAQGLARMQRRPTTAVTGDLARELAQRSGARALVVGEVNPAGRGYVLSASVVSAADGSVLTAVRENAADDGELLEALDRLSRGLRRRIGESFTSLRDSPPLERVTTGSLEALRHYSEAIRHFDRGEFSDCLALLRQAVAIDTGFAMAWRKIAATLTLVGGTRAEMVATATRAYRLSDRLPDVERQLAVATYYSLVEWDPARMVTAYRAALDRDSTNEVALNNLAIELSRERRYAAAESLYRRVGRPVLPLAATQVLLGRPDSARVTLQGVEAATPNDPMLPLFRIALHAAQHDFRTADSLGDGLMQDKQRTNREYLAAVLALIAGTQGRLTRFRQALQVAVSLAESHGSAGDAIDYSLLGALVDLVHRGHPGDALADMDTVLGRHPLDSLAVTDRPYAELARFYAIAGRPAEAERLLGIYARLVPDRRRHSATNPWTYDWEQYAARGQIAVARGRFRDAIPLLRAYYDSSGCDACGLSELANAYDRLGESDSAVTLYRRFVDAPGLDRLGDDLVGLPRAYRRLGELYEERGDRADALEFYGRFVDLWRDADPELQPAVNDVKARMTRLAGERPAG